jgi:hypothetical protein
MRTWILIASVLLAALLAWAWIEIDWALEARRDHATPPDEEITIGTEVMTQEAFLLLRVHPREEVGALRHNLLRRRNLYPILYVVAGLAGACAALWLLLVREQGGRRGTNWDRVAASVLLSGLAGLIAYLLLKFSTSIAPASRLEVYENWVVFPVLAGAFNTTFYEALPSFLTILLGLVKKGFGGRTAAARMTIIALALGSSLNVLEAQETTLRRGMKSYYKCGDPASCKCRAFTDQEKDDCSECNKWVTVPIAREIFDKLMKLDARYRNAAGRFLSDASEELYDFDIAARPVSAGAVYARPEQYGFKQVDEDAATAGTIVVYPNMAGVVVNQNGDIAYPSATLGGKLNIDAASDLGRLGVARYLMPDDDRAETAAAPPDRE